MNFMPKVPICVFKLGKKGAQLNLTLSFSTLESPTTLSSIDFSLSRSSRLSNLLPAGVSHSPDNRESFKSQLARLHLTPV